MSTGSTLGGSWLPRAKSSTVTTAEHSRVREAEWIRPPSCMRTPVGVTACDKQYRNVAVWTKASDSKLPDQLADSTASNRKRNETAKRSSTLSRNASLNVLSSRPKCRCPCHTRSTGPLPSHEYSNVEQQSVFAVDTGIRKLSGDSRAVAKGKDGKEDSDAFSRRMTRSSRCYAISGDADDDGDNAESRRSMQRLTSARSNR